MALTGTHGVCLTCVTGSAEGTHLHVRAESAWPHQLQRPYECSHWLVKLLPQTVQSTEKPLETVQIHRLDWS